MTDLPTGSRGDVRALPPAFAEHARDFYAAETAPVEPRKAATVLLLRDADEGVEVFMIRRSATMAFAGGLYAFPGGAAEAADADIAATAARELAEETGVVGVDLRAWSRWVTPEFEPRRYDTWFYVAALPGGQEPANLGSEADRTTWVSPELALDRHREMMLPPTAVTLDELAGHPSTASVLTAALTRDLAPILPRVLLDVDPPRMTIPGDAEYPA
ncbi:NUDIX hydrolase [Phytomonospora sp. NPDC050363]|uniref:NUDIX hydrolase n=1 Tax=Phytomonospora sp. NPDC050363 TaxID=3155642 RepID=UPI0033F2628C